MPREHVVTLRVNGDELDEIDTAADERGLSRAEYVRQCVLDGEYAAITRTEFEALAERVRALEETSTERVRASTPTEYDTSTSEHAEGPNLSWYDYDDLHKEAVDAVWEYVRERGELRENPKTQIIEACFEQHDAGRSSTETWWTHVVANGVLETEEVERPHQRLVRWVG